MTMSAIPGLKKKLKSVRATGKLSKAMKTVSSAKLSRLSLASRYYTLYAEQYRFLYDDAGITDVELPEVPPVVIVCGSNRGFCGGFNHEVLRYLQESVLPGCPACRLAVCGDEMIRLVTDSGLVPEAVFSFGDVPGFAECTPLLDWVGGVTRGISDYPVRIVYPAYKNTLTQIPSTQTLLLHPTRWAHEPDDLLWAPDRETVLETILEKGFRALVFGRVLETALGAQAATLMTMRTAYDTATEYTEELEGEIHRQRQKEVTADVIETASERGHKGDDTSG